MNFLQEKKEIINLIPNKGIVRAIESLKEKFFKENDNFKTLILIESHVREIRRKEQQGVISHEKLNLELSSSRKKFLDFLDDITEKDILKIHDSFYFTDSRDLQAYKAVRLKDGKIWMAENLNFKTQGSYPYLYDYSSEYTKKYGRAYTYEAALKACPIGWHLPSVEEWENLLLNYGGYIINDGHRIGVLMGRDARITYNNLVGKTSPFNGLLGGIKEKSITKSFRSIGQFGGYWSTGAWESYPDKPNGTTKFIFGFKDSQFLAPKKTVQNVAIQTMRSIKSYVHCRYIKN